MDFLHSLALNLGILMREPETQQLPDGVGLSSSVLSPGAQHAAWPTLGAEYIRAPFCYLRSFSDHSCAHTCQPGGAPPTLRATGSSWSPPLHSVLVWVSSWPHVCTGFFKRSAYRFDRRHKYTFPSTSSQGLRGISHCQPWR